VRLDYAYNKVHDKLYERYGASGSSGDAFAYDKLRRLTNAWIGSSSPSSPVGNPYTKKIDYNYDDDANRTSVVVTPYQQSPSTTSYTTNNLNEYTDIGGTSQSHDANGNLTDDGTLLFEYDYMNHIVRIKRKSDSSVVATYRYDALGRRVEKDADDVERYIRSIVAETLSHIVAVYDGANNWQQSFAWNDEIDGIQMLEQADVLDYDTDGNTTETTRSFYHRNALGSVMEITDLNEATAVAYRYDPYGTVTVTRGGAPQATDPLGQCWTFTGRFLDEESGLLYYRARYYSPLRGRFLQRDPVSYWAGPNLYAYVSSRPTVLLDPTGLQEDITVDYGATAPGNYFGIYSLNAHLVRATSNRNVEWSEEDCKPKKKGPGVVALGDGRTCLNITWECSIVGTIKLPKKLPMDMVAASPFPRDTAWMPIANRMRFLNHHGAMRQYLRAKARHMQQAYEEKPEALFDSESGVKYKKDKKGRGHLSAKGTGKDQYKCDALTKAKNDARGKLNNAIRDMNEMLDSIGSPDEPLFTEERLPYPRFAKQPPPDPKYK
jgi:RHS repeat-associated protein